MAPQQITVSVFKNIHSVGNPENHALLEVLDGIKSRSNPFQHILKEIAVAPHDKANTLKLALPPICFSGTFSRREDSGLIDYSQLVCIDVDDVSDIRAFKQEMKNVPFVYSCFTSPSGKGLKVLVFHDCKDSSQHADIYRHIGNELGLTTRTDLKFDTHCSNISRACFFSFDPALFINRKADVLTVDVTKLTCNTSSHASSYSVHDALKPLTAASLPSDYHELSQLKRELVKIHEEFERFHSFYPGVRNQNLNILCCKFRSEGFPEEIVSPYLQLYYGGRHSDFTPSEILACVHSVYNFRQ